MIALKPILVVAALLFAWVFSPLGIVPMNHISRGAALPYSVIFFSLLYLSLVFLKRRIEQTSWVKVLLISLVGGHFLSVLSLFIAELFLPNSLELWANSLRLVGILQLIGIRLVFPFLLAGWIIGPLAAAGMKVSKR